MLNRRSRLSASLKLPTSQSQRLSWRIWRGSRLRWLCLSFCCLTFFALVVLLIFLRPSVVSYGVLFWVMLRSHVLLYASLRNLCCVVPFGVAGVDSVSVCGHVATECVGEPTGQLVASALLVGSCDGVVGMGEVAWIAVCSIERHWERQAVSRPSAKDIGRGRVCHQCRSKGGVIVGGDVPRGAGGSSTGIAAPPLASRGALQR